MFQKPDILGLSAFASVYDLTDISPFPPSAAVYWMDGWSDATFVLRDSQEKVYLDFTDRNTVIAASSPFVFDEELAISGQYTPVPEPLDPSAHLPLDTPARYQRNTTSHMMQVISMNMKHSDGKSRLLIGLPYLEDFPEIYFNSELYPERIKDASSFGIVQSLTEFSDPILETREEASNGYPARSFFAIYHILDTPAGTFFNKKATQMELQPSPSGKLALKMPPIPFSYNLINGPIPLYDVQNPDGKPIGNLVAAHHNDRGAARAPTDTAWPFHQPNNLESLMETKLRIRDV